MADLRDLKAYEILEERDLADIHSKGYLVRHKKSGAKLTLISNDDENKVFCIGFRTPADDSTGVPHIIEHTVLCGSDKYPVKDPFVELVKGSLNTFLNAMTYPDKTIYPVASCNEKDFQNLMSVYMDAVFHPNIYKHEEIFKQEGWHYELEDKDAPITINGVVYNEMKGAFSSADDVLQREVLNSLFPDTTYRNESGGDPDVIPELTYEEYLNFHRRYYHPCNSYIYLYGDMDMAEKLKWMDEVYLSHYEKIELDSEIQTQKAFDKPVEVRKTYSISQAESEKDNTYLAYSMVVEDALQKELSYAFDVLDYALVSAPGAPLKKALLDAGIGTDISGNFDNYSKQPFFSITAKNSNASEKDRFVAVIRETLEKIVKNGMDKDSLLAGINSAEFRFREADYGSFPKGLFYVLDSYGSWLYDESQPFLYLEAIATYKDLKEKVDTGYFEQLIQKYMLDNTHASLVIIEPEKGLNAKKEKALEEKLAAYKASLSEEQLEQLIKDTKHLKAYQEEPSPKEDLDKIPMLTRGDMKKEAAPLLNEERMAGDTKIIWHDVQANGIEYFNLLFDISDIAPEDLPYLGILKYVLSYVDTEHYNYAELSNAINIHTGGINTGLGVYLDSKEKDKIQLMFEIRSKVLFEKLPEAMRLIKEIICSSKMEDEKRLREIISELKSRLQMNISGSGHIAAITRAMSYFSETNAYSEETSGIAFYQKVAEIEADFETEKEGLKLRLQRLVGQIFTKERLLVSLTCAKDGVEPFEAAVKDFEKVLPSGEKAGERKKLCCTQKNEGFMEASQVQYVARSGNFAEAGYEYTGALKILKVIMGYDYLWINIRVKGGAYGCMNGYSRNGDTYFVSYRDPNLRKTDEIYDKIPEYVENFEADEHDMTKYIIGTISSMDTPMNPSAKGSRSMAAYLQHITLEELQKEREQVICATDADIRALADMLKAVLDQKNICVIGNEDAILAEKDMFTEVKNLNV